jgi:hypothetical protein
MVLRENLRVLPPRAALSVGEAPSSWSANEIFFEVWPIPRSIVVALLSDGWTQLGDGLTIGKVDGQSQPLL